MDETSFSTDPSKTKIIGTGGFKTIRVSHGGNRETHTVLACYCADGSIIDPLFVFSGRNKQSTWLGTTDEAKKSLVANSDNGWMTSQVFTSFFDFFVTRVKTRPILLIVDGHASHTSLDVVERAISEEITILKLPPHCTDLLQPLDVSVFKPLKDYYDQELTTEVHKDRAKNAVNHSQFVNIVCSAYPRGLSESNVKSGFRATGIYPLDKSKYDVQRLDPHKLEKYEKWLANGAPKDDKNRPILSAPEEEVQIPPAPELSQPSTSGIQQHITSTPKGSCSSCSQSSLTNAPVPASIIPITKHKESQKRRCEWVEEALSQATMEELLEEVQKRAPTGCNYFLAMSQKGNIVKDISAVLKDCWHKDSSTSSSTTERKRRKINTHSVVITHEEAVRTLREQEEKKENKRKQIENRKLECEQKKKKAAEEKAKKTKAKKTKKAKAKKVIVEETTSESESEADISYASDTDSDIGLEDILYSDPEIDEAAFEPIPRPEPEPIEILDSDVGKFYAVLYTEPNKVYYWGQLLRTFSEDEDAPNTQFEFNFMRKKCLSSDPRNWTWVFPKQQDKSIVPSTAVFRGPEEPKMTKDYYTFDDFVAYAEFKKFT